MKKLLPYLLLILIVFQSLGQLTVFISYTLNKEAITAKYCENLSKPKLECKGKCYVKKQLKKLNHDQTSERPETIQLSGLLYLQEEPTPVSTLFFTIRQTGFPYFLNYESAFLPGFFHPPAISV